MHKLFVWWLLVLALVGSACGQSPSQTTTSTTATSDAGAQSAEAMMLVFGELTERNIDIAADGRNTTAAVEAMNRFAVDLYSALRDDEAPNMVISPYSAAFALSMIYAGADGVTATEMESVLHVDGDDWHEGINAYDLSLDARTAGSPTTWSSANKIWTQQGLALADDYLDVLTGSYGSPIAAGDFSTDPDAQRKVVNGWVAGQTRDLVPELFPEKSLSSNTAMVLVNAVAMDAPWEFPFDPTETGPEPFTRADGSTVTVPTMHYDDFLPSARAPGYQAVELADGGGALSMVVIQPSNLEQFEDDLTVESLGHIIDSIKEGGIHLSIPKWSARTHLALKDTLIDLGMPSAFGTNADFSKMAESGGLALDRVEHEAYIEVDEQGTRAAAATGGAMALSHGPTITIDRPFLYVIRDQGAGTILFMGRVTDPSTTP